MVAVGGHALPWACCSTKPEYPRVHTYTSPISHAHARRLAEGGGCKLSVRCGPLLLIPRASLPSPTSLPLPTLLQLPSAPRAAASPLLGIACSNNGMCPHFLAGSVGFSSSSSSCSTGFCVPPPHQLRIRDRARREGGERDRKRDGKGGGTGVRRGRAGGG